MTEPFAQAAALLPPRLRRGAEALSPEKQRAAEELRLRAERGFSVTVGRREQTILPDVSAEEVAETVTRAARGSLHSVEESIKQGFLTAAGGHRVGLCGSAVRRGEEVAGLRAFSSVSIRIAREMLGIAAGLDPLLRGDPVPSLLIISPPGGGKTTLLRELVRTVSERGVRVGVADERGELAGALGDGNLAFDLGRRTDVLDGVPKGEGALMLLRAMSPQVIAMDEITAETGVLEQIRNCGVSIFATLHAGSFAELSGPRHAPLRDLFSTAIRIETDLEGRRHYEVQSL